MPVRPSSRWKYPSHQSPWNVLDAVKRELEQKGEKVVDLRVGDPVVWGFTNQFLSDALIQAAKDGWHMYPFTTPWYSRLLTAIVDFEKRERNLNLDPENIIFTSGVAEGFHVLHYTLLDAGDEILTFDPCHYLVGPSSYLAYFKARAVSCCTVEKNGWEPDLSELRSKISDKTKGIVVVSPNNPTGAVYSERMLKNIIDIAGEYDLPIISDEIYGLITFNKIKAKSMVALAPDVPVIMLSGISKIFMGPGWRVGYLYFHDPQGKLTEIADLAKKVWKLYGHSMSSVPTPILVATTKVLAGSIDAGRDMVRKLQVNRDFTIKRLREIDGISCTNPKGALYAFPRVHAIGEKWKDDIDFLLELMIEKSILFNPGSMYGRCGYRHFRTLLMPKLDTLADVYERLEEFLKS